MAKTTKATAEFELTPEEQEAIVALRQRKATGAGSEQGVAISDLAAALVQAIETTRPPQKKTPFNRPKPWELKRNKLKRAWYQHGLEISPRQVSPEAIDLMNLVKPGVYVNGLVRVVKNRDRSYNITWPVATSAQRLRVMNEAGSSFEAILQRCIDEFNNPKQFKGPEDDD